MPGRWQQRWHQVLVYFGLANPYTWDEPKTEPEPRLTGWRQFAYYAVLLAFAVVGTFVARGLVVGLGAAGIAAVVLAIYSRIGERLRTRSKTFDDASFTVGFILIWLMATDDRDFRWPTLVGAVAVFALIAFALLRILERFEPPKRA